jgi:hypothetical protein
MGQKRFARQAYHIHSSGVEFKDVWRYTSLIQCVIQPSCFTKHHCNFTFQADPRSLAVNVENPRHLWYLKFTIIFKRAVYKFAQTFINKFNLLFIVSDPPISLTNRFLNDSSTWVINFPFSCHE